ncbi:MAG: hypothetical protein ACRCTE_12655 [Cellulosilyticaceae bacterium]
MKKLNKKLLIVCAVMLGLSGTVFAYNPSCNHSITGTSRTYHSACGRVDTQYNCKFCGSWWGCGR